MKENLKLNKITSKLTNDMALRMEMLMMLYSDSVSMISRQVLNYTSNIIQKESSK